MTKVIAVVLSLGMALQALAQDDEPREVSGLYAETCANCHGAQLQGSRAGSLIDDTWMFGGDDASVARSIAEGRPDVGMPPFGSSLSEQEIRALVVFIREKVSAAQREAGAAGR